MGLGGGGLIGLPASVSLEKQGEAGISGRRAGRRWPGGCLTAPLLSAGEAFLGSFVASGMGPSASSHGSPVPLPSDLSFRSPTPSNLPMVQLWAAHAHEGKERARRAGRGRWAAVPSTSQVCRLPSVSTVTPPCGGLRGPALVIQPPCCSSDAQRSLLALSQGLYTCCSLHLQPRTAAHWLSPVPPPGLGSNTPPTPPRFHLPLVMTHSSVCFFMRYLFPHQ